MASGRQHSPWPTPLAIAPLKRRKALIAHAVFCSFAAAGLALFAVDSCFPNRYQTEVESLTRSLRK
jgi:hypothetical protein